MPSLWGSDGRPVQGANTGAVGKGWSRGPPVDKDEGPGDMGLTLRLFMEGTYSRQNRDWNPLLCRGPRR